MIQFKKIFRYTLFTLCINLTNQSSYSQDKQPSDVSASYGKASINYLSNYIYTGRKDSLAYPYITPVLGYFDKSGFYITGSLSYLSSKTDKRVDMFALDLGYEFSITEKFTGSVYGNKSFYNKASSAITNDMTGSLGSTLSYDFGLLQLNSGTDVYFSSKPDFALNLGLSHQFIIGSENQQWTIEPSALVNFSSLHYYEGFTNNRIGRPGIIIPNSSSVSSSTTVNKSGFTLLDYEIIIPISYEAKTWGFTSNFTFAFPKNPIYTTSVNTIKFSNGTQLVQTIDSTPYSETNLKTTFFAELGVYFKF